jgi:hypothetical protein
MTIQLKDDLLFYTIFSFIDTRYGSDSKLRVLNKKYYKIWKKERLKTVLRLHFNYTRIVHINRKISRKFLNNIENTIPVRDITNITCYFIYIHKTVSNFITESLLTNKKEFLTMYYMVIINYIMCPGFKSICCDIYPMLYKKLYKKYIESLRLPLYSLHNYLISKNILNKKIHNIYY